MGQRDKDRWLNAFLLLSKLAQEDNKDPKSTVELCVTGVVFALTVLVLATHSLPTSSNAPDSTITLTLCFTLALALFTVFVSFRTLRKLTRIKRRFAEFEKHQLANLAQAATHNQSNKPHHSSNNDEFWIRLARRDQDMNFQLGDTEEQFSEMIEAMGRDAAMLWLLIEIISACWSVLQTKVTRLFQKIATK